MTRPRHAWLWPAMVSAAVSWGCGGSGGDAGTAAEQPATSGPLGFAVDPLPTMPTVEVPVAAPNVLRVALGRGPSNSAFNSPYVSVTVCAPGTDVCQVLEHVLVDTGSSGLRIFGSSLPARVALPPVVAGGLPVSECMQFASGYTWGTVRQADVRMAGERASSVPVHVIDDGPAAPASCTRNGPNLGRLLDARAVLGIGMSRQDCGAGCAASNAPGIYHACGPAGCAPTALALQQQVGNPVAAFERNNNGVVVVLPQVPLGGAAQLEGALVFGVGTQSNNALGSAQVFDVDKGGNLSTRYRGTTYPAFLDTGSNAVYFPDADLPRCGTYYCPFFATALAATITSPKGAQRDVDVLVDSLFGLRQDSVVAHTAGPDGALLARMFDWGLPFFFGRAVHLAIQDAPTPVGRGPYWAF